MQKFKIVPASEEISEEDAMIEFNSIYTKTAQIAANLNKFPSEIISQIKGKVLGETESKIRKLLGDKFVEGKLNENISKLQTIIEDLKKEYDEQLEAVKNGSSEPLEKAQKELEKRIKEIERLKADVAAKETEVQTIKSEYANKEKAMKIEEYKRNQLSSIPLVDDKARRLGFEKYIEDIKIEIDDDGKIIVAGADGLPIMSKKKAGEYADLNEVATERAIELEVIKKSSGGVVNHIDPSVVPNTGKRQPRF